MACPGPGGQKFALVEAEFPMTILLSQPELVGLAEPQPHSFNATVYHWIWSDQYWGKTLTMGHKANPDLGKNFGLLTAATVGTYSSGATEKSQISDGSCSVTAHTLIQQRKHIGPVLPMVPYWKGVTLSKDSDQL